MPLYKNCEQCNKEFSFYPFDIKERKFCSLKCYWEARQGGKKYKGYWIGKKRSLQTRLKISKTKKKFPYSTKGHKGLENEKHPFWKGEKVSYGGLHYWVSRKLGKPTTCEHCGKTGLKGKFIHWANKSHQYKRELSDWIRLCAECHKKYDKK